jgi:internalin A
LRLDRNQLTSVPSEIGQLTELRELRLDRNQLTSLPPGIGQLTNLPVLWLDGNQLISLPPGIGQLTNLRELQLNGNQLASIPSEISRLKHLRELHLNANRLSTVPRELALLPKETILQLADNPLIDPFAQMVRHGPEALRSYLFSLHDAVRQYEAKVLLVGEGKVGKTSLVAALHGEPFVEERDATHGIEIRPLILSHPALETPATFITLRTWDFGGQELYRVTHQFFFSRRSVYLLVWSAREGHEQDEVEEWLQRIRLRVAGAARVLVVATYCDDHRPELDYPNLQNAFSDMLMGRHEIDNRRGNGINDLRRDLAEQASKLPQMGQWISRRWIAVGDDLVDRAQVEPYILFEEFVRVCTQHKVPRAETEVLAELLHDLGRIIYYSKDDGLRDIVVLNPEWLTKAISYVLDDKETRDAAGVLDHKRLKKIWQDRLDGTGYPARYHPYFLRLMEKFDVSYRIGDDKSSSLVAQLVPYERPDLPWGSGEPVHSGVRALSLVCQFSAPAPGLIAWLTVRQHRASTGLHWRRGVFLRHPIPTYASEALLELRSATELSVEVRAPSPDFYFNVLRDTIENLIEDRWPGMDFSMHIPCPTRSPDGTVCSARFPLKGLISYRERGHTAYSCLQCETEHDVSSLLTGFPAKDVPLQSKLDDLHGQIVSLATSVDELKYHSADTAESVRILLGVAGTEVTDCPRLFTLAPKPAKSLQRLIRSYKREYRLVLWCEHPECLHPCLKASYDISSLRFADVAEYAILVFKALRVAVPIALAGDVILNPELLKEAELEIELMESLVDDLPSGSIEEEQESTAFGTNGRLTRVHAAAARAFRVFMFRRDPYHIFGGLRRHVGLSGELLWICSDHAKYYDPGLPDIPDS